MPAPPPQWQNRARVRAHLMNPYACAGQTHNGTTGLARTLSALYMHAGCGVALHSLANEHKFWPQRHCSGRGGSCAFSGRMPPPSATAKCDSFVMNFWLGTWPCLTRGITRFEKMWYTLVQVCSCDLNCNQFNRGLCIMVGTVRLFIETRIMDNIFHRNMEKVESSN